MKRIAFVLVFALSGCAGSIGVNQALRRDGKWAGVSGPAEVVDFAICADSRAAGTDVVAQPIEGILLPRISSALGAPMKVKQLAQSTSFCTDFGQFNRDNFEVLPRTRKLLDAAFAECGTCNAIVVPVAYIWWDPSTSDVTSSNGTVVARVENGGKHVSGDFITRIYVFTRDGELALNNGAVFKKQLGMLAPQLRNEADGLVEKLLLDFPWDELGMKHAK